MHHVLVHVVAALARLIQIWFAQAASMSETRSGCGVNEQEVKRTDASGIAQRRMLAQNEGHRLGAKLQPGMWVAARDRLKGDQIWIGQGFAVPGAEADTPCIHSKR